MTTMGRRTDSSSESKADKGNNKGAKRQKQRKDAAATAEEDEEDEEEGSECTKMLVAHGGETLDLDAQDRNGNTALHCTVSDPQILKLLIDAGASPLNCNHKGETPLELAHRNNNEESVSLLEAAIACVHTLLQARALSDINHGIRSAFKSAADEGLPMEEVQAAALAAAPACLKERVAWGKKLPQVEVAGAENEKVVGVLK